MKIRGRKAGARSVALFGWTLAAFVVSTPLLQSAVTIAASLGPIPNSSFDAIVGSAPFAVPREENQSLAVGFQPDAEYYATTVMVRLYWDRRAVDPLIVTLRANDAANNPGVALASAAILPSAVPFQGFTDAYGYGAPPRDVEVTFDRSIRVAAGERYWLSLEVADQNWYVWDEAIYREGDVSRIRHDWDQPWGPLGLWSHVYAVYGTPVPEPAVPCLLLAAVSCLGRRRRSDAPSRTTSMA